MTQQLDAALLEAERLLKQKRSSDEGAEFRPRTLRGAVEDEPQRQRRRDLRRRAVTPPTKRGMRSRRDLHVLLFSDNVPL